MTATSVVYVLPDKVGGVFSVVKNLLQHRPADGWTCHAVLTDNRLDGDARSAERLPADGEGRVEYRLREHLCNRSAVEIPRHFLEFEAVCFAKRQYDRVLSRGSLQLKIESLAESLAQSES